MIVILIFTAVVLIMTSFIMVIKLQETNAKLNDIENAQKVLLDCEHLLEQLYSSASEKMFHEIESFKTKTDSNINKIVSLDIKNDILKHRNDLHEIALEVLQSWSRYQTINQHTNQ